jgi:hypothetical protein
VFSPELGSHLEPKTSTKMESRWAKQVPEMLHTPCINQRRLAPTRGQYHRSPTQDTEHGMYFSRPNHVGNGRPSPLLPHAFCRERVYVGCDAQTDVPSTEASGANCVQKLDDSRDSAIHTKYRISLRSSS